MFAAHWPPAKRAAWLLRRRFPALLLLLLGGPDEAPAAVCALGHPGRPSKPCGLSGDDCVSSVCAAHARCRLRARSIIRKYRQTRRTIGRTHRDLSVTSRSRLDVVRTLNAGILCAWIVRLLNRNLAFSCRRTRQPCGFCQRAYFSAVINYFQICRSRRFVAEVSVLRGCISARHFQLAQSCSARRWIVKVSLTAALTCGKLAASLATSGASALV